MEDIPELSQERFNNLLEQKLKKPRLAARDKQGAEAKAMQAEDGRISSTVKNGLVQLNARVPLDLKNQVIETKRRSGREIGAFVSAHLQRWLN